MGKTSIMFNFTDGAKEVKVGDSFITVGRYYQSSGYTFHNYTVEKIGSKLVTANRGCSKFIAETGKLQSDYSTDPTFSSMAAFEIYQKEQIVIQFLQKRLGYGCKMSLGQARQIAAILEINIPWEENNPQLI